MRDGAKFRKLVWLLLFAALAAIAGGGCLGSSSSDGGGNVISVGKTDHPLSPELTKRFSDMPEGTIFIGNKATSEELADMQAEMKEAFDAGRVIGRYAPTQREIDELRRMLGVNVFKRPAPDAAAEQLPEFYMITKRGGNIFEFEHLFLDADQPGVEVTGDESAGSPPILDGVEPIEAERRREKSERYGEIAANIAAWHRRVEEDAKEMEAGRAAARADLRAAAADDDYQKLTDIASAYRRYKDCSYDDIGPEKVGVHPSVVWKFPTVSNTITIYSCYSFDKDENWYLIIVGSGMNPKDNYKHEFRRREVKYQDHNGNTKTVHPGNDYVYNSTHSFKLEANMNEMISDISDRDRFSLEDHLPVGINKTIKQTYGCSAKIGGSFGIGSVFPPTATGSVTGGINISNSHTYDVSDYTVYDNTDSGKARPAAEYRFRGLKNIYYNKIEDAPTLARDSFNQESSWIWRMARSEDAYQFQVVMSYSSYFKETDDDSHYEDLAYHYGVTTNKGYTHRFYKDLPMPPTLGLNTSQLIVNSNGYEEDTKPVTFKLLSNGHWEASCDADWVDIGPTSGDATKGREKEILVQIDPYEGKGYRDAMITVIGPKDPDGVEQVGKIKITQEGNYFLSR